MDYEKKYKDALDAMRMFIYPKLCGDAKLAAENVFSELRESEDERIMKKMIEHFKSKTKDTWCNMPVKSILDWLEKQKVLTEHKEGIYYYYRDGTFTFISPPAVENPHNFTVPKPNEKPVDYDHEMWKNCEANFEGGKKEVIDHPEKYGLQKEQKPAWSEEDEKIKSCIGLALTDVDEQRFKDFGTTLKDCLSWLKSLLPQPKSEWSEEDKDYYDTIVRKLEVIGDDSGLSSNQIKFLREHCPLSRSEWNEEDETIIEGACSALEIYGHTKLAGRLKSLRPSWKPSEEQMSMLRAVINDPNNSGAESCQLALRGIYEQLKKL